MGSQGREISLAAESMASSVSVWGYVTWKCLRTTASDSPKLQGGSQHFPVQSSTQPSVVSTGWVPACFRSETIEQYPLVRGEKKENQCDSCEQIRRWWGSQACEMQNVSLIFFFFFFFLYLNLANFKAVIANLMHELCDTLSHGEVLHCLSACQAGVLDMIMFKDADYITHHTNLSVELFSNMKTTRKILLINNNHDYNIIVVALSCRRNRCNLLEILFISYYVLPYQLIVHDMLLTVHTLLPNTCAHMILRVRF